MKCKNCKHELELYDMGNVRYVLHFGAVLYCQHLGCNCFAPIRSEQE